MNNYKILSFNKKICQNIYVLSTNNYGSKVVLKLIEKIWIENNDKIFNELKISFESNFTNMMLNKYSGNIIIKFIQMFSKEKKDKTSFIYQMIKKNIRIISCDKYGCSFIQKILDISEKNPKKSLINNIICLTKSLIFHQYGTYVLHYIIEIKNNSYIHEIVEKIVANNMLKSLVKIKNYSGIIEKCIENSGNEIMKILYQNLYHNVIESILDPQAFYGNS
jgi:hypothetical protein